MTGKASLLSAPGHAPPWSLPLGLLRSSSCAHLGEPFEWVSGLVSSKQDQPLEGPALALFLLLPSPEGRESRELRR